MDIIYISLFTVQKLLLLHKTDMHTRLLDLLYSTSITVHSFQFLFFFQISFGDKFYTYSTIIVYIIIKSCHLFFDKNCMNTHYNYQLIQPIKPSLLIFMLKKSLKHHTIKRHGSWLACAKQFTIESSITKGILKIYFYSYLIYCFNCRKPCTQE